MSIVLVDSKYFGHYLTRARKTVNLRRADAARILSVSHRELIKIENGKILMPHRIIEKIMTNGLTLILSKRRK